MSFTNDSPFSDEDLVALKDMLRNAKNTDGSPLSAGGIKLLVARLEAAEACLDVIATAYDLEDGKGLLAWKDWRKAAGK
jgi:hypothetical protein